MTDIYLRDVLDLPESVHAGDFKIELAGGFTAEQTAERVREYVVTDQLREAFADALTTVRGAVRSGNSYAAYLHGSFGAGKSHFLTVLHAILNGDPAAREKPGLRPVIAAHDEWLRGRRFLMVPYHLIGAADLTSALLGGYVATVRAEHPGASVPPVYRSDQMLDDARRQRAFFADDALFARWLGGTGAATDDPDDLDVIDAAPTQQWTTESLDEAFAAPHGDPIRRALESALLGGPYSAYARGARGDTSAFVLLEDGLAVIAEHAKGLGYHGIVLFLDELILWLQAHMSDQRFVNTQVNVLVNLIESGVTGRALPIVSFISRQRDLTKLVGEDVTGADVKNLEAQVEYLAERFDIVELEDSNLPAIVRERVLKPRPGKEHLLDAAFASIESSRAGDRDVLLDATGVTGASWDDFRRVYPLSPALLNVLVVLSTALQRERTGLKLLQEMLHRRRDDMRLGELIPLGDLWDVLADGTGAAFTDQRRRTAESGRRFHDRVRAHLLERYGSADDPRFVADMRFVKTLLLAALAGDLPALSRLTGARIAALNLGSIRSRTVEPGRMVVTRLRELQGEFGELRSEGQQDPVFALHLSDLDVEPLLDMVGERDTLGARRIWVKQRLWSALGVPDTQTFVAEREHVWRGTRRTVEFVFGNVRDTVDIPDQQFQPSVDGRVRVVLDYPFDEAGHYPSHDIHRVDTLRRAGLTAASLVWIPHFLTDQRAAQLGRLIKIEHLLDKDRLDEYAVHLSSDDRARVRVQLQTQRDNLTSQLGAALDQAYGIARPDPGSVRTDLDDGVSTLSLLPGHNAPRLASGAPLAQNVAILADGMFAALHPQHPDFDPGGTGRPLTIGDLRVVLRWITKALATPNRRTEVASRDLPLVRRVVHGLRIGEVAEGPLHVHGEWKQRIEQLAAARNVTGDYQVDEMRQWIAELAGTGLHRPVANLVIATYALLADRAWIDHGGPADEAPDLDRMGAGDALRAQVLPTADEFATARRRLQTLFGETVPDALFARNVAALATKVHEKVAALEPDVNGVWQSLRKHAGRLGLDADASTRVATARAAADLLATLAGRRDPTALVRELAAGADGSDADLVLGSAIVSAPNVLRSLDGVEWGLLDSVRGLVGRDGVGDRAERLVRRVGEAAGADQFDVDLVPVLAGIRVEAIALLTRAAELARPDPAPPLPPDHVPLPPVPNRGPEPAPDRKPEREPDREPKPAPPPAPPPDTPAGLVRRQVTAAHVADLVREIERAVRARPDAQFEVTWRVCESYDTDNPEQR